MGWRKCRGRRRHVPEGFFDRAAPVVFVFCVPALGLVIIAFSTDDLACATSDRRKQESGTRLCCCPDAGKELFYRDACISLRAT